jgi:hypothetical protein
MLALPNKGINRSVNSHNIDLNVFCDWIEASVVFADAEFSKSDVTDILIEEQIYKNPDFAAEMIENAWAVISRRVEYLSHPLGVSVDGNRIKRIDDWTVFPAYGFCLALSCVKLYSGLPALWGNNFVEQGALFEELTAESLRQTFQGWTVKRIGWSSTSNPVLLRDVFPTIIHDLNEIEAAEKDLHLTKSVKDLGLDLLAFYSFGDMQASSPVLLVQCASGKDWQDKRHTPDTVFWENKIISFNSRPMRGFAIPFSFAEPLDFRRDAAAVNGVFVDRYRLLKSFTQNNTSVSVPLNTKLTDWMQTRVGQLSMAN